MALSKLNFNSLNLTPVAGKGIGFDSGADDLEASFSSGSMTFIKKLTASSDGTLSFVNGASDVVLDSTYKEYIFIFKDIHASSNEAEFTVNFRDGSTAYDATKTSTAFRSFHFENDSNAALGYQASHDLAQATGVQKIGQLQGNSGDHSGAGMLTLFNPSSTTFVKHFIARYGNHYTNAAPGNLDNFTAGYCNVTAAIDAVQFAFTAGNIDAGTITLYGIN